MIGYTIVTPPDVANQLNRVVANFALTYSEKSISVGRKSAIRAIVKRVVTIRDAIVDSITVLPISEAIEECNACIKHIEAIRKSENEMTPVKENALQNEINLLELNILRLTLALKNA